MMRLSSAFVGRAITAPTVPKRWMSNVSATERVKPFSEMPGPVSVPVYGGYQEYLEAGGPEKEMQTWNTLWKRYGDVIRLDMYGTEIIGVCHPDDVQTVYNNEGKYPAGVERFVWPFQLIPGFEDNLGSLAGEEWKERRKLMQKDIFSPKEAAAYLPLLHDSNLPAAKAFKDWATGPDHDMYYPVLSFDLLQRVMYNSGAVDWSKPYAENPMKDIFVAGLQAFYDLGTLGRMTPEMASQELKDSFVSNFKITMDYLGKLMNEAKDNKNIMEEASAKPYFLKVLERGDIPDHMLLANTGGLLFAALDTTANTIQWIIYNLARSPQVQDKLYEEVRRVTGGEEMTKDHLNKLPYMKACIKESFRATPISAANIRILHEDITLRGYNVPAGTLIMLVPFSTYCTDEKVYPKANEFIPERWDKEAKEQRKEQDSLHDHPYMILPFSVGPRMCLGSRVAELEVMSFIATLLQQYKIELAPGTPLSESRTRATTYPHPRPQYVVTDRQQ